MSGHPYDVLDTVESSSSPGTFYEIRTSHRDGKTYCTCPGWIHKARKSDGICKHIAAYMQRMKRVAKTVAEVPKLVIYKLDEFLAVKRNDNLIDVESTGMKKKLHVNRGL